MNEIKVSKEKFAEVVDNVQLAEIFLKSCNTELHTYPANVDPLNTALNIDNTVAYDISEKHLFCFLKSTVGGIASQDQGELKKDAKLFDFSVEIVLTYELQKKDLDLQAIEMFAGNNSLVNGFPFLRETIISMSTRMAIPPVLLPLMKPMSTKNKKNDV